MIGELFDKLGSIDGANRNLRGSLFELVGGYVVQARHGGSIDINHLVRFGEFRAEIDVRRVFAGDVWIYECRGYQPGHMIGLVEIEAWLTDTMPSLYRATKAESRFNTSAIHFEFWTSGGFTTEALARFEEARSKTQRYAIG